MAGHREQESARTQRPSPGRKGLIRQALRVAMQLLTRIQHMAIALLTRVQHVVIRLLSGLLYLLRADHFWKALAEWFVARFQRLVAMMSPIRFLFLLVGAVVITALAVFLYRPPDRHNDLWRSQDTALLLLPMQDSREDAQKAIRLIKDQLSTFVMLECEPATSVPNLRVLHVKVGCYRENGSEENTLRIDFSDLNSPTLVEEYESTNGIKLRLGAEHIVQRMREQIFAAHPLRGSINTVPRSKVRTSESPALQMSGTVKLDIGRTAGVRSNDKFDVLDPNSHARKCVGSVKVIEVGDVSAQAIIEHAEEEFDEGYLVEWAK